MSEDLRHELESLVERFVAEASLGAMPGDFVLVFNYTSLDEDGDLEDAFDLVAGPGGDGLAMYRVKGLLHRGLYEM